MDCIICNNLFLNIGFNFDVGLFIKISLVLCESVIVREYFVFIFFDNFFIFLFLDKLKFDKYL